MLKFIACTVLIGVVSAQLRGAQLERSAVTTRLQNQPNGGDGSYQYAYDTSNGISVQENGVGGQISQGTAQWTDPAGVPVGFSWVADGLGGYRASGSHIPTPPPIPAAILKSIEWIRTHPSAESQGQQPQQLQPRPQFQSQQQLQPRPQFQQQQFQQQQRPRFF